MRRISPSHADELHAYAYRGVLFLRAIGTNPGTGWRNWFQPARDLDGAYDFMQEIPAETLTAAVPFNVVDADLANDLVEVVIRMEKRGSPVHRTLPVIHALNETEASSFSPILPEKDLGKIGPTREAKLANSLIIRLGTVDVPLGCSTSRDPFQAMRKDFYLEIEVGVAQDIERAVKSCLRQPAITGTLSKLLAPVGWTAGIPLVADTMMALLADRLSHITRVSVTHRDGCL